MKIEEKLASELVNNDLVPKPARSSEGSVTCSDLICELEAARDSLTKLLKVCDWTGDEFQKVLEVRNSLTKRADAERGRSQIAESSNSGRQA